MLGAGSESLSVKKTLKSDRNSRLSLVGWDPGRGPPSADVDCFAVGGAADSDWENWVCFAWVDDGGGRRKEDGAARQPEQIDKQQSSKQ